MRRVLAQCRKELLQFRRDRLTLGLAFLLPLLTLLIFGFAIRLETKVIPIVVQDFDRSPLSAAYTDRLFATDQFRPAPWRGDDPVADAIDRGLAKAAVIIPPEFSRRLKAGQPVEVQVLVDGTDTNNARVIRNGIQGTTAFFLSEKELLTNPPPVQALTRLWFNPGRKESLYIVPGVYAVVLWIFPSLLAAIAMVKEKDKGTILQVYASGIRAPELLLGKALAYLLVGLSMAVVVMGLGGLIFQLGFAGDPTPLLVGTTLYLAAAVLFGLLLGVRSANQNAAVQGVSLVGFLSALLLSGFIYPLSNIPPPLSLVSALIPARYFIVISRDAFVRGTGWVGVWLDVLMILALAALLYLVTRRSLGSLQLADGGGGGP
ncbi:ABC transporter permease [Synechococcus sp. Cruz-9H2]|uniref:ABC transporter permease n=1 Tax=unclassified Synechococcus TaxID=2626047 RepID=UPI0020CDBE49|nr:MULTISPECIES: ABC transporter permease [unclassified Synechococcus]MCP9818811.1 ABC transporter permease [Synechococcus sp. Cruz-9H2]MCP9843041.1 ABC transporter permease [Synechococcus sp. Edmonson 11F2]MCP9857256.1 ABC transporter permease [Synechococcus sp. Cruz-9C9]MCP9862047.1 ABC transporter permease [Synechococcus sp. Cruz-7E5]MCP9869318.1 ABC transporter permease [Synechococcus sp. Cruz-7B9]